MATVPKVRDYSHLRAYQFKPGQTPPARSGRPKGTKNALTTILEAAPIKARQYIKSTAPAVLVDARKWIMPIESDGQPASENPPALTIHFGMLHVEATPSASLPPSVPAAIAPASIPASVSHTPGTSVPDSVEGGA